MKPSLSILVPCYNVEDTVRSVITDAYEIGSSVSRTLEIIAVNDASADRTGTILASLRKSIPPLSIITHTKNQGYGKTIKELYSRAGSDWLFSLPGDGQFDTSEIKKLLPHTTTSDMILGWRNKRNDPAVRLIQSGIYNRLLNGLFGINLHDANSIRLMRKDIITTIRLNSDSAFVDAELAIKAKNQGFTITEVPVTHKERRHKGATGGKFFKTIWPTIVDIIRLQLRQF